MNSVSAPLRRVAVFVSGYRYDLAVPAADAFDRALAVAGVRLGPQDLVFGPGGATVEPATPASDLLEGGLYTVTSSSSVVIQDNRYHAEISARVQLLPWVIVAGAITVAVIAFSEVSHLWRYVSAVVIGVAAFVLALRVALRSDPDVGGTAQHNLSSGVLVSHGLLPALLLGWIAGVLAAPTGVDIHGGGAWEAMTASSLGFVGVAVTAMLLSACSRSQDVRAGALTAAFISVGVAIFAATCPFLGWSVREFLIVSAAVSVFMIRALPALIVNIDEGYSIDYARYMALRWSVRGKLPRFIERVVSADVRELVAITELRLQIATVMFSILAVPGIVCSVTVVSSENLVEVIGASIFVCCSIMALLLVSRRMAAPMLKRPQHAAALLSVLGVAGVLSVISFVSERWLLFAAVIVLCVGVLVAVGSVAVHRGFRSLGWSRVGDIVEAVTIVVVLPAALLAAGAIDVLRGVFS